MCLRVCEAIAFDCSLLCAVLKERSRGEWMPEYIPQSHGPPSGEHAADTVTERGTRVTLRMIMEHVPNWCE